MSETTTRSIEIDTAEYWAASMRAQELMAVTPDDFTAAQRTEYFGHVATIDEMSRCLYEDGATTGDDLQDRLIRSGQIVDPSQLEELRMTEAILVTGEPVLLQKGLEWNVGILADDKIFFSYVVNSRTSYFAIAAQGYQSLPVMSRVALGLSHHTDRFDVRSLEPKDMAPETMTIGMSLGREPRYPYRGEHFSPDGLRQAFSVYDQMHGREVNKHGDRDHNDGVYVGLESVEGNLGISLEELLNFTDNDAISAFLNQRSNP